MKYKTIGYLYKHIAKPYFFRNDPEEVHDRITGMGKRIGQFALGRAVTRALFAYRHPALEQDILGMHFANPIGLSAGFDKNAELTDILPAVGFGFAELGSITGEPCEGNPKPRLWRIPEKESLRVYYGLKNDGAEAIAARLKKKTFAFPVGISIAKTNCAATVDVDAGIADYLKAAEEFRNIADYVTINISCPNAYGGEPFSDPDRLEKLLRAYHELQLDKPTFIKLAADLSEKDIDDIIDVGERYDIDGYICTNLKKNKGEKGGLSGKSVGADSDRTIRLVYQRVGKRRVIIGCGGVFTAEDAYRKIKAGASLIQMITGMIYQGPQTIGQINKGLVKLLEKDGYASVSDVVGVDAR